MRARQPDRFGQSGGVEIRRFEVTGDDVSVAVGGVEVKLVIWDPGEEDYVTDPQGTVFTVWMTNILNLTMTFGMRGYAQWFSRAGRTAATPNGGRWEVIASQPRCLWCAGVINAASDISSTDTNIPIDAITRWGPPGSREPDIASGKINGVDVKNTLWEADLNDDADIFFFLTQDNADPPVEYWDWVQADCYVE